MSKITDDYFNRTARQTLRQSGEEKSGFSRQFCDGKILCLYSLNNGDYLYDFDVKSRTIKYKLGTDHPMDRRTKRLVNWLLLQNWIKNNLLVIIFVSLAVAGVGTALVVNENNGKVNTENQKTR